LQGDRALVGSGIDVSYNTFLQQTRPKIIELGVRFPQPHQIIKVQQLAEEKSGEFTRVTTKSYNKVPEKLSNQRFDSRQMISGWF